jgi:transposase
MVPIIWTAKEKKVGIIISIKKG